MVKDAFQPFKQALLILGRKHLHPSCIGIWERHNEGVSIATSLEGIVVFEFPKVNLRMPGRLIKRQKTFLELLHFYFPDSNISLDTAVTPPVTVFVT
jgi:hypothetical protein